MGGGVRLGRQHRGGDRCNVLQSSSARPNSSRSSWVEATCRLVVTLGGILSRSRFLIHSLGLGNDPSAGCSRHQSCPLQPPQRQHDANRRLDLPRGATKALRVFSVSPASHRRSRGVGAAPPLSITILGIVVTSTAGSALLPSTRPCGVEAHSAAKPPRRDGTALVGDASVQNAPRARSLARASAEVRSVWVR